jgi:hypothetical protein
LRPPIVPMLARPVDALPGPDSCAGGCAYEPKFDGWRCIVFRQRRGAYLQSRAGRPLAGFFPEIARICREVLPVGVVVDGELVVWEPEAGRTSFALLQRRVSAGRRVLQFARQHPAHLVVFDLLQMGELPVLEAPLVDRRGRLAALLGDAPNQLTLCPQTVERDRTVEWFATMTSAGVEGLVIKALSSAYQPGRRGWSKYRSKTTTEAIVGGVIGSISQPEALLLGRLDAQDRLRYVASRPHASAHPGTACRARGGAHARGPAAARRRHRPSVVTAAARLVDRTARRHRTAELPSGQAGRRRGSPGRHRVRVRPMAPHGPSRSHQTRHVNRRGPTDRTGRGP